MKYLKERNYYEQIYDKWTIKECRRLEDEYHKKIKHRIGKKMTDRDHALYTAYKLFCYMECGERYLAKEKRITELVAKDKEKDDFLESKTSLNNIYCKYCGSEMENDLKTLIDYWDDKPMRVLFFYKCPNNCKKNRAFYDNGEEYIPKPHLCEKCNAEMKVKRENTSNKKIFYIVYTCTACGHIIKDREDFRKKKEPIDKNFERDKKRFCLDEKGGAQYVDDKMRWERMKEFVKEHEEREKNKGLYDKVAKIQKLNVAGLRELLEKEIIKGNYSNLNLINPQNDRHFNIEFTIQDDVVKREQYDSRQALKKIINSALSNTNWRLMSEGVSYRLGILSGRFKAYESEEDLIRLLKSIK